MLRIFFLYSLLFAKALSQVYTVGDYVNDFSGDICHNGDGLWSYEENGRDRVTWINLFTSW